MERVLWFIVGVGVGVLLKPKIDKWLKEDEVSDVSE